MYQHIAQLTWTSKVCAITAFISFAAAHRYQAHIIALKIFYHIA